MALVRILSASPIGAMIKLSQFTIAGTVTDHNGDPAARQVLAVDPVGRSEGPRVASSGISSPSTGAYSLILTGVKVTQKIEVISIGSGDEYSAIAGRV